MAPEADSDLKRLHFVQEQGGKAINYTSDVAGKVYTQTKQYLPESLHPTVKRMEDTVSEYGSPALTTVQDKGGKFLQVADSKVPRIVLTCRMSAAVCHEADRADFRDHAG